MYKAIQSLETKGCDLMYIAAGINDCATKLGHRKIKPIFRTVEDMVQHFNTCFDKAIDMPSPPSKAVVLCEMPGRSFGMYNRDDGRDYYELQSVFNEGIRLVNARIQVISN